MWIPVYNSVGNSALWLVLKNIYAMTLCECIFMVKWLKSIMILFKKCCYHQGGDGIIIGTEGTKKCASSP